MKNIFKYFLPICLSLITMGAAAQAAPAADAAATVAEEAAPYSPYQDPVFYGLLLVVVVLLIFILQLQRVFAGVAKSYAKNKSNSIFPMIISLITLTQLPNMASAANEQAQFLHDGFGSNAINALMFIILVEIAVVLYYVRLIRLFFSKEEPIAAGATVAEAKVVPSFWDKFNASVELEKEAAILTDHDYDGIQELDNSLPPWWKYGFYFTIIWAVFYLGYFHVTKSGPLSDGEYKNQMAEAEIQMAEYRKKAANLVDETTVVLLTDAGELAKGKATFEAQCVTCHGASGEGKVGPNLTDKYWKHGGDIKDLFKTVKLGVSGTGMKSWKSDLSPMAIAQVTSYILTLQGTNPAGAKAPEGDLYEPKAATAATDTTVTASPADTTMVVSAPIK
jgi:cytochrome c oxidase cbb3-type subunit 3